MAMSATRRVEEAFRSLCHRLPRTWKPHQTHVDNRTEPSILSVKTANSSGSSGHCWPSLVRMKGLARRHGSYQLFSATPTPPTIAIAAPTPTTTTTPPPLSSRAATFVLSRKHLSTVGIIRYGHAARFAFRSFSSTSVSYASDSTGPKHVKGITNGNAESETESVSPKGNIATATTAAPQGNLSIVFTDIVKSTAMWEKNPSAMSRAMSLHDASIRSLIERNRGYEVKQNGDGFMIAFSTAASAVQFCLDVQEDLLAEHWPVGILDLPNGQTTLDDQGHVLFRGLKLRMSAHWGTPVSNWNEIIQRMDYLGPMVNRAARFIEVTEPGQIVVSEDFLLQLQGELTSTKVDSDSADGRARSLPEKKTTQNRLDLNVLRSHNDQDKLTDQSFAIKRLGNHRFKGLDEPQTLYFLVPESLEGRVAHWHQVKHVSGVKGNVRSDNGQGDGGKNDD
ncbi:hypothetical protein H2204_005001 [Knufia peltigerae]|uniref:Guanylate cyclase domain-containing protein n=1 Tax=Knufia peltigerae TaxID=1002370 RepID=A0AA38Y6V5_9EURO|nr:hypothetical protein H2204_005001 [Knufia peltigerae]